MTEDRVCFDLTAIDDDIAEGDEYMTLNLFESDDQNYKICEDDPLMAVIVTDNDGEHDKHALITHYHVYSYDVYT